MDPKHFKEISHYTKQESEWDTFMWTCVKYQN